MARYFFHLRNGIDEILDPEGKEFDSMEALRESVLFCARDLLAGDLRNGVMDFRYRIDAEREDGVVIYSLAFKHAVNIIPEIGELPEVA
jgi:hypothetical protein